MSVNLGNLGCEAARSLRGNPDWVAVCEALKAQVTARMTMALDASPEKLADAVGYARALKDIYVAFEAATKNINQNQVQKPGPVKLLDKGNPVV